MYITGALKVFLIPFLQKNFHTLNHRMQTNLRINLDGPCTNRTVNETILEEITVKALNQILSSRKVFLKLMQENIARAVVTTDTLSPDGIQARLKELQKDLVKAVGDQKNYDALTD